jgi:hypothetical protein
MTGDAACQDPKATTSEYGVLNSSRFRFALADTGCALGMTIYPPTQLSDGCHLRSISPRRPCYRLVRLRAFHTHLDSVDSRSVR